MAVFTNEKMVKPKVANDKTAPTPKTLSQVKPREKGAVNQYNNYLKNYSQLMMAQ